MSNETIRCFLLWIGALISINAYGQTIPYRLYTVNEGLPNSQIQNIFQDSRGYIWVGTYLGLSCFNGGTFKNIGVKEGLPYSYINTIQEDGDGNIWFGTGNYFCKYDGKKLTSIAGNVLEFNGKFYIDKTSTIWTINTKDQHLYYSKDFKNWSKLSFGNSEYDKKVWYNLQYDSKEECLLLSDSTQHPIVLEDKISRFLPKYRYNLDTKEIHLGKGEFDAIFKNELEKAQFLKATQPFKVADCIGRNGKIYFITKFGKNLYRYEVHKSIDTIALHSTGTTAIFEDKDKNVWVASEDGLIRVFLEGIKNFTNKQLGFPWSLVEDDKGAMWFGDYYTHRLFRYDGKKIVEQKINYALDPSLVKGDLKDFYYGGSCDSEGNLYFSNDAGVIKWDKKRFAIFPSYHPSSYKTRASNAHDLSLNHYLDTARNILLSCKKGGFNLIDLKNESLRFCPILKGANAVRYITDITKDLQGKYWMTINTGVYVYDYEQDTVIKSYTSLNHKYPYFSSKSIYCDYSGSIWVGTAHGLLHYDTQKDSFIIVAPNVINSRVNTVSGFKNQFLVCNTNDGVYFLDIKAFVEQKKEIVRCFNQHNGYLGHIQGEESLYVDSKGNVWVSATDMVTKISPSELDFSVKPLQPYVTQINNENITYRDYKQTIELPYGINTAKIFFEAVGFQRPFNAEFSYKLDNGNWSEWRQEEFAVLDNLSSGLHAFFVRTRPSGTTDETEIRATNIQFKVSIPFYRASYFPVLAVTSLFLIIFAAWYFLRKQQQNAAEEQRKQADIVKERTQQMKYLEIQTLQSQLNPHFIFNVLQVIQTRIFDDNREAAAKLIVDLGNLIRRFLESSVFLGLDKIRNSEISLQQEISMLKSYIEFEQMQFTDRFTYSIEIDETLDLDNIQIPPMLIQPYVENAIKHGILYEKDRKCTLLISFVKNDYNMLVCRIIDDGVGRKRAKEIQQSHIQMYKSRGTQILEERIAIMREIGYGINVDTFDNKKNGTIVELKIEI
jgi:ligand-binding sensor domain-containing protein